MKKNIFKIDNYLITYSVIQIVILTLALLVWPDWKYNTYTIKTTVNSMQKQLSNEDKLAELQNQNPGKEVTFTEKSFPAGRVFFLIMGFVLLATGIYYRIYENKILSVWNAVEISKGAKLDELTGSLGLSKKFILGALPLINSQNQVYYIYDSKEEKILDGKFRIKFNISEKCPGCGNMVSKEVTADFSETIKCDYCGTAIAQEVLNRHKMEILNKQGEKSEAPPEGMNYTVFVLLFLFFWPAAIVYAIQTNRNIKKNFNIDELKILKNIANYNQGKI